VFIFLDGTGKIATPSKPLVTNDEALGILAARRRRTDEADAARLGQVRVNPYLLL